MQKGALLHSDLHLLFFLPFFSVLAVSAFFSAVIGSRPRGPVSSPPFLYCCIICVNEKSGRRHVCPHPPAWIFLVVFVGGGVGGGVCPSVDH